MIHRRVCPTTKSRFKLSRFRWIGVAWLLLQIPVLADEPSKPGPTAAGLLITRIAQYWQLSPEQKAQPVECPFGNRDCDLFRS